MPNARLSHGALEATSSPNGQLEVQAGQTPTSGAGVDRQRHPYHPCWNQPRILIWLFAAAILLALALVAGDRARRAPRRGDIQKNTANRLPLPTEPLTNAWLFDRQAAVDHDIDMDVLRGRLWKPNGARRSAADLLHLLHIAAPQVAANGESARVHEMVRLFTDAEAGAAYFGAPTLVRTRTGVCSSVLVARDSPAANAKEAHRDQLLCVLSELRLPLNSPLVVAGERHTLDELLQDSIANFSIRQTELAWSVLAYARYLPPKTHWVNKFGVVCSFENAVDAILQKPFESSCAGTHAVQTLTFLLRIDESGARLFGEPTRRRIRTFLRRCVIAAVSSQYEDGTWSSDWHNDAGDAKHTSSVDAASAGAKVLATGHLAEWMLYLPTDLAPAPSVVMCARRWLAQQLARATPDEVNANFCPYSHALLVLELTSPAAVVGPS